MARRSQLSIIVPVATTNAAGPQHQAAGAAARSVIRRSGCTVQRAFMAARAAAAGAHPSTFELHHAAAWHRAQQVAVGVAWPGGRAPAAARLAFNGARP